jgi:hypothetical protein
MLLTLMRFNRIRRCDDRRLTLVLAAVSVVSLAGSVTARTTAPSPFAPRIHVRWADGVSEAQRTTLERDFALLAGIRREGTTWEYDLAQPSRATIRALIDSPTVADTHYLDRGTGEVTTGAPRGATPLDQPGLIGWIHTDLFDWFIALCFSSFVVSSVRLASGTMPQRR